MKKYYKTHELAEAFGLHPNTIRKYEAEGFFSSIKRLDNNYREFSPLHYLELKMIRLAFKIELLHSDLRGIAYALILSNAQKDYPTSLQLSNQYLSIIEQEEQIAEETITHLKSIMNHTNAGALSNQRFTRQEVATKLAVSIDSLRNWERNNLLAPLREKNRVYYTHEELQYATSVRLLRQANFSLMSILRMISEMRAQSNGQELSQEHLKKSTISIEVLTAYDQLFISLEEAMENMKEIQSILYKLIQ